MFLCFCFILKYHGVVILNSAFGNKKRNSFKNKNQTQMPVSMFVGSCSIVISASTKWNEKSTFWLQKRINIDTKSPTFGCLFFTWISAKKPLFFRYFNEFLMAHHRQVAREIRDEYIDTMSKIYFSYFKTYISKLLKLQVSVLRPNNDFTLTIPNGPKTNKGYTNSDMSVVS